MSGVVLFIILSQIAVICYTVVANLNLCFEKEELRKERDKYLEEVERIRLLNKLKVDCDGNPINYGDLTK